MVFSAASEPIYWRFAAALESPIRLIARDSIKFVSHIKTKINLYARKRPLTKETSGLMTAGVMLKRPHVASLGIGGHDGGADFLVYATSV